MIPGGSESGEAKERGSRRNNQTIPNKRHVTSSFLCAMLAFAKQISQAKDKMKEWRGVAGHVRMN
jgi:hypothetical protein